MIKALKSLKNRWKCVKSLLHGNSYYRWYWNTKLQHQISQPGEIRKEYEAQLQIFRKELEIEKQNELKASSDYIMKLFKEEAQNQIKIDLPIDPIVTKLVVNSGHMPYALNNTKNPNCSTKSNCSNVTKATTSTIEAVPASSNAINNTSSKFNLLKSFDIRLNRGPEVLNQPINKSIILTNPLSYLSQKELLTVPPTNTHRAPSRNPNSADSLKLEMCHFKPIKTEKITPYKRSNDGILKIPKIKRTIRSYRRLKVQHMLKSSFLNEKILRSRRRRSAFSIVKPSPSRTLQPISYSITNDNHNPIVLIKRLTSQKFHNESIRRNIRINTNTYILQDKRLIRQNKTREECPSTSQQQHQQQNKSHLQETDMLKKIILEQKRCEDMIKQEKLDFQLALKLQNELDTETVRTTNSRKTRQKNHAATKPDDDDEDEDDDIPAKKYCRRTCGRTVVNVHNNNPPINGKQEQQQQKQQVHNTNFTNIHNLRRSTRKLKRSKS